MLLQTMSTRSRMAQELATILIVVRTVLTDTKMFSSLKCQSSPALSPQTRLSPGEG